MVKRIKRKISAKGRKKLRKNAMKGVHKWERMSHKKEYLQENPSLITGDSMANLQERIKGNTKTRCN